MIALSSQIGEALSGGFWHGAIVFFRVAALASVLPGFGERTVPVRIKIALAVMLTAVVAPAVTVDLGPPLLPTVAGYLATETLVGLALGLALRLFVLVLQTAGSIAAQSTSLSQLLGGAAAEPVPAMGYILVVAGLAFAMMTGLHVRAAELLIRSYDLFPPGVLPDSRSLSLWGVRRISEGFALAFTMAAPFVIASVIYNLTLGVINRAMPQLMVAFVGAPVITFGGLFLLFAATPLMLSVWSDAIGTFLDDPVGLTR